MNDINLNLNQEIGNDFNLLDNLSGIDKTSENKMENQKNSASSISLESHKDNNSEILNTEEIYLNQKSEIKKIKEKSNKNFNELPDEMKNIININEGEIVNNQRKKLKGKENNHKKKQKKIFNGTLQNITLKDYQFFEKGIFDVQYDEQGDEENTTPIVNSDFILFDKEPLEVEGFMEFDKKSLRTINEIDYKTNGIEINVDFSLLGQSEFWIFTRIFVNKEFNESQTFDKLSLYNEPNDIFNKYSSAIKIFKELNSNKCYISLGTFYENPKNKKLHFKSFFKRQLVNLVDLNNKNNQNINDDIDLYDISKDISDINIIILDRGTEIIEAKISLNNKEKYNSIKGNFFLPIEKRSKIVFGGFGQSIQVRNIKINTFIKEPEGGKCNGGLEFDKLSSFYSYEQKTCSCCTIY